MLSPEQIIADWIGIPTITAGMTELHQLIASIRAYGDQRVVEERERCAVIASDYNPGRVWPAPWDMCDLIAFAIRASAAPAERMPDKE